ncbi:hypothetical protein [Rheinheimera sp.]|uniref:hypothetical protein n=1 Tax=Rheinheimera sp. TaxID=1869214 RepID=UPI00307E9D73
MAETYLMLKLLHIVLFVYWLGGDLGTFYASRFVAKEGQSAEQRLTALKIMMGVDQGPRICMALMLGPGIHMAYTIGLMQVPAWAMVATWLLCLVWLGMVLAIHFGHDKSYLSWLTRFDFNFRLLVIAACLYFAIQSLLGDKSLILADFIAWKLIVFAALVGCGLGIRLMLKPFGPAFMQMLQQGPNPHLDAVIQGCLARARPFVYLIWLGLLLNTALGMHLINP